MSELSGHEQRWGDALLLLRVSVDGENPKRRVRRTFVTLLIVLTAIGAAASTTAIWAHQVVFDTDRFVETVGPLIDDPDVQDALATRLTDAIMTGLDVESRVQSTLTQAGPQDLPISATVLAGPITDGIRVTGRARRLASPG